MGFRYFCVASCNNNAIFVGFSLICLEGLTVCYFHSTYEFQSESTLYSFPECQGTPGSKQVPYLKLSDCNEIRTQARRNENNSRGGYQLCKIVGHHGWPTKKMFHFKSSKTARKPKLNICRKKVMKISINK